MSDLLPTRPRLIVCAFTLPDQRGHYYNELVGYKEAAKELELICRTLVPRSTQADLAANLDAEPVLEPLTAMRFLAKDIFGSIAAFTDASLRLDSLWTGIDAHEPNRDDIVFFTSAHPVVIAAVGSWLSRRSVDRRPAVFFRIVGDEWLHGITGEASSEIALFRMACADLRTREGQERVFLLGSNETIVRKSSRAGCRRVFLTSLPKYLIPQMDAGAERTARPCVYVNLNRKSLRLVFALADVIGRTRKSVPDVRFVVKPSDLSAEQRAFLKSRIAPLADILPAEQDPLEYFAAIARSSVVLLAYKPPLYRTLNSGVFVEAVNSGKPVVVPAGTSMSKQIADGLGVGTIFEKSNAASITEALVRAIRESDELSTAARAAATRMHLENSSRAYVERLVELSRQQPDMEVPYKIGQAIDLRDALDSRCFMREGWAETERWGTWTMGDRASLHFRLESARDIVLKALVRPFLHKRHRRIVVTVSSGEREAARWTFSLGPLWNRRMQWRQASIPVGRSGNSGSLDITFTIDAPASPASLGRSPDLRLLGLGFRTILLEDAAPK